MSNQLRSGLRLSGQRLSGLWLSGLWLSGGLVCCSEQTPHDPAIGQSSAPPDVSASGVGVDASDPRDAGASEVVSFERQVLSTEFVAEGATFCDVDREGHLDVVAGADWYVGPEWTTVRAFRAHQVYDPVAYSDAFATFCHDFDVDGWPDILIMGFPGTDASWYQNPAGTSADWVRHLAFEPLDNEAPTFADLTGDGAAELVMNSGGYFGWAGPDSDDPTQPFAFHPISPQGTWERFTHGLGIGDLDADGHNDVLDAQGYWRAPADVQGDPVWARQQAVFGEGGAQMYAYDVDGDGDRDVITTLQAHGYGVAWYERTEEQAAAEFVEHVISGTPDDPGATGVALHEPHALALVDIDADGLEDLLTGERFWGHAPAEADRDPTADARLVWFRLTRDAAGAHYTPYIIDTQSGIGVQVVAERLEDGRIAVVVANKKGVFGFRGNR